MEGAEIMADLETLNDLLAAAEDRLVDLRLGVSANVRLEPDVALVFTKRSAGWGLYVDDRPLHECSKRIRVLAAGKLDALVDALTEAARERFAAVRQAVAKVEGLLVAFGVDAAKPVSAAELCPCGSGKRGHVICEDCEFRR